jgi:pimeloyl-ACP methyl ester carboxylesterase
MKKSAFWTIAFILVLVLVLGLAYYALVLRETGPERMTFSPDGVRIAYQVAGKDSPGRPALVFVHGWCADKGYWNGQVAHFAPAGRVIALDLAGHGDSDSNRKDWTIEAFGADVAAVVNKEKPGTVILIGHSLGGEVILEAARSLGDRVVGLVAVDSLLDLGQSFPPDQAAAFVAPFKSDFAAATAGFAKGLLPEGAAPALVERVAKDMASSPALVAVPAMEKYLAYRPEAALKVLRAPLRAINSDKYPTNVEGNKARVPSFEARIMVGTGHYPFLERPGEFNGLLAETIAEILAAR